MTFAKETDLCAAYLDTVPEGWTPYAETTIWAQAESDFDEWATPPAPRQDALI